LLTGREVEGNAFICTIHNTVSQVEILKGCPTEALPLQCTHPLWTKLSELWITNGSNQPDLLQERLREKPQRKPESKI